MHKAKSKAQSIKADKQTFSRIDLLFSIICFQALLYFRYSHRIPPNYEFFMNMELAYHFLSFFAIFDMLSDYMIEFFN